MRARRLALFLLTLFPVLGVAYASSVRLHLLPARPDAIAWLALLPAAALGAALLARARGPLLAALAELGLAFLLHAWVTAMHVWRLD